MASLLLLIVLSLLAVVVIVVCAGRASRRRARVADRPGLLTTAARGDGLVARATLVTGGHDVSGTFEFGSDGMPVRMTAERFTDKGELRPWGGVYRDWRTVSGMRVPFEAEVTWQLESGPCTYAHWLVDSMEYDDPTSATYSSQTSAAAS